MSEDPRAGFPTGPEPWWPRLRRLRSGTLAVVRLRRREPERPLPGLADPPSGGYPSPPEPVDLSTVRVPTGPAPGGRPPHRPHPAANAWPDDAVTVTYAELRRLIGLHLTLASSLLPHDRPWVWLKARARAVQDGEAPLLLSEVMEP